MLEDEINKFVWEGVIFVKFFYLNIVGFIGIVV